MFGKGWIFFRILAWVLFIGLLIGGGTLIYQAGQAQGYAAGLAAAGKELSAPGTAPIPYPYYGGFGPLGWHIFPFGPVIGFFFFVGLMFLFFGLIGGGFRRHAWRHPGEAGGYGPWAGYPRPPYPWGPPPAAGQPGAPASPEGGTQNPPPAEPGR